VNGERRVAILVGATIPLRIREQVVIPTSVARRDLSGWYIRATGARLSG